MDITKYISENIDKIIDDKDLFLNKKVKFDNIINYDNIDEKHESEVESEVESELEYSDEDDDEKYYENIQYEEGDIDFDTILKNTLGSEITDDSEYYMNLLNIFTRYYNLKYDKSEHYFSGIKDSESETTSMMEMFYDGMYKYKEYEKKNNLTRDEIMKIYIKKIDFEENQQDIFSKKYFNIEEELTNENDVYCMEIYQDSKYTIVAPLLFICLNYLIENNIEYDDTVHIFNLHNF